MHDDNVREENVPRAKTINKDKQLYCGFVSLQFSSFFSKPSFFTVKLDISQNDLLLLFGKSSSANVTAMGGLSFKKGCFFCFLQPGRG